MDKFRELAKLVGELAPKKVEELADLHARKNQDYGDAYGETARELGLASALTPINYKIKRLNHLAKAGGEQQNFESIGDNLLDTAAYLIMAYVLFEEGVFDPSKD